MSDELGRKIEKSLKIMQEASDRAREAGTPLIINFSGGKDSSCLLLLAKKVDTEIELLYMSSGIELPGSVEFVQKEADKTGYKLHITYPYDYILHIEKGSEPENYTGEFPYWVKRFGYFPSFRSTYCSSRLKLRASTRYFRGIFGYKPLYKVNGVRRSESKRRRKIYHQKEPIRPDYEASGHFLVEPIHDWTGQDVLDYLKQNNFEIQEQYNQFGVAGCAYCPFYQVEIYQRILSVYPNIYDDIIALEEELGKPSVAGNLFLKDIKEEFMANRDEIMKQLAEKDLTNKG